MIRLKVFWRLSMNKDKLKALCHKLSKESGLPFNMIQTHYFLERILEQISSSSECENFIFKGGFLLSNVIGIRQRSTLDIDVNVNIRMYNFDDVQCTVIPSVAYGFVTGMNLQLC